METIERSATRIAEILGKTNQAQEYKKTAEAIPISIKKHMIENGLNRFVFQLRKSADGSLTVNDSPYPAHFVLGYYDIFDPVDETLYNTIRFVKEGPLYGRYSDEIFGFEGIDVERATRSGFWIGQAGHGWMIP